MNVASDTRTKGRPLLVLSSHPHLCLGLVLTLTGGIGLIPFPLISTTAAAQSSVNSPSQGPLSAEATSGIKEEIPDKCRKRYDEWKNEFLSTETGRNEWQKYEHNTGFLLTITVSRDRPNDASTEQYKWNDSGTLAGATIKLGCRLDKGYPEPGPYYPVTSSLVLFESWHVKHSGRILAAAKMTHEFGHVDQVASMKHDQFELKSQLARDYFSILLGPGPGDLRLVELARQMGGTPEDLWKDREYWAEAKAMLYISEKIAKRQLPSLLVTRIKQTVDSKVKSYVQRRRILMATDGTLDFGSVWTRDK